MSDATSFFSTVAVVFATFCGFIIVAVVWLADRIKEGNDGLSKSDMERYKKTVEYLGRSILLLAGGSVVAMVGTFYSTFSSGVTLEVAITTGVIFTVTLGTVGFLYGYSALKAFLPEPPPKLTEGGFVYSEYPGEKYRLNERLKRS